MHYAAKGAALDPDHAPTVTLGRPNGGRANQITGIRAIGSQPDSQNTLLVASLLDCPASRWRLDYRKPVLVAG